jgi:hypothetical protein
MSNNIGDSLILSLNRGLFAAASFIPNILAGIVILLIGIILGSIVKRVIVELFNVLRIEAYLKKYGIPEAKKEFTWTNIISEVARWFVIILFLVPTADVWGLPQVTTLLNTFLLYLPNVFVAAIIALVGLVLARLAHDVVLASTREVSPDGSQAIASIVRWAITVFVMLAVLNQLGVAQDLVRILFTGFVAMISLAGGIAFGLGGQDTARTVLESIRKNLSSTSTKK